MSNIETGLSRITVLDIGDRAAAGCCERDLTAFDLVMEDCNHETEV